MVLSTRRIALSALGALVLTGVTTTSAQAFTDCTHPDLSQPFAAYGDQNFYALAPAGDFEDVASTDWKFSSGARVVRTSQADGSTGSVLELASGAVATSPSLCITADYPTARLRSRNVVGSEGVAFAVSYPSGTGWTKPSDTGSFQAAPGGWTLSKPLNLKPLKQSGWQMIRVSLKARGTGSRFQVDDFWIDPRASR